MTSGIPAIDPVQRMLTARRAAAPPPREAFVAPDPSPARPSADDDAIDVEVLWEEIDSFLGAAARDEQRGRGGLPLDVRHAPLQPGPLAVVGAYRAASAPEPPRSLLDLSA